MVGRWGGVTLFLPLLSSCAPCENPLNKKNLISINTAYTLRGFTDLINPAKDPLGSLALVGFHPILQDCGGAGVVGGSEEAKSVITATPSPACLSAGRAVRRRHRAPPPPPQVDQGHTQVPL